MAIQKWHKKASVQAAIITGGFLLLASVLPSLVSQIFSNPLTNTQVPSEIPSQIKPINMGKNISYSSKESVSVDASVHGVVVISQGQTGGQIAQTINNYGPMKRLISNEMKDKILKVLGSTTPGCVAFASTQGDPEASDYKVALMSVFREAGWEVKDVSTFMFSGNKKGLVITIPFNVPESGKVQVVAQALSQTGSPITANKGDMANGCGIYVQVWSAS